MGPFVCSVKKSVRRSTWQIKDGVSHELVPMHGLQSTLDRAVADLGGDPQSTDQIWDFVYDLRPLERSTFQLVRTGNDVHQTIGCRVEDPSGALPPRDGWIATVVLSVFPSVPVRLWVRLEPAQPDRPVFLSRYS